MAEYEELEFLAAIENLEVQEENNRFQRRFFQYKNAFTMSDRHFVKHFRFTKELIRYLIELVRPYVRDSTRASSIPLETKVNKYVPICVAPIYIFVAKKIYF